jgi:peptidoglycan-associated lipoprotein
MRRMNTSHRPLAAILLALLLLAGCASSKTPLNGADQPPPIPIVPVAPDDKHLIDPTPITKDDGTQAPLDDAAASLRRIIYFDFDSAEIRADAQRDLEALARHFRHAQGSGTIVLEGHADERGGREYNLALGQKRAEAVRRALALLGVPAARMEAISWGEEKPVREGKDEQAFSLNRRVELPQR